jgi:pyruvate ferredoxin oxidoreductase gamma subunit
MLRIRFHGRGGHGVKTASRILGTAAFLGGMQAQDSPVYGAERRGAAIAAFTRIDSQPIRERGVVLDPDLIVVGDETLLSDPMAGVLKGSDVASAVFVNSSRNSEAIAGQYQIPCPVRTLDLTAPTSQWLGRGSALSTSLGAAACALVGLGPVDLLVRAVRQELGELHISPEVMEKNIELTKQVYVSLPAVHLADRQTVARTSSLHAPEYVAGRPGVPIIYAPGNSPARHTGSWRIFRPIIDLDACTRCGICFAYCPDGAITLDAQSYPAIDYDNCKGCMICPEECPVKCIREQKEVRAW